MPRLLSQGDFHTWLSRASLQQHLSELSRVPRAPIHILFHAHFLVMPKSILQNRIKT